jgi:hypothetical protein
MRYGGEEHTTKEVQGSLPNATMPILGLPADAYAPQHSGGQPLPSGRADTSRGRLSDAYREARRVC